MMRQIIQTGLLALVVTSFSSCILNHRGKPRRQPAPEISVPAGTQIPALALAFDIGYNQDTDDIIPGYKILSVGIINNSLQVLELKPLQDEWDLIDRNGKQHVAILNLRYSDVDTWATLPKRLKKIIEYPLLVNLGETKVIDLLFPDRVDLSGFSRVTFRSASLGKVIHIFARESGE